MFTDMRLAAWRPWVLAAFAAVATAAGAEEVNGPGAAGKPVSPIGQGAGFHSPQSRFPELKERDGVVSWKLLSAVTTRVEKKQLRPVFPQAVQALDGREVTVQGFMMPLDPGKKQKHFLLSAVPTTCSFCMPAGPEGLIDVRATAMLPFTQDAVTLRGKMSVLPNDPHGLYYRLVDVQQVR